MKLNSRVKLWFVSFFTFANFIIYADTWTDPDTGYTWTYEINGDTAEIHNGFYVAISPSPTGSVTIPPTLGGKPVTSIGEWAFRGCSGLTSVTIPNSVTSIGEYAFANCSGLTSVTIPNSVTSIGEMAFRGCSGLLSFSVAGDNPSYKSVAGLLLTKDGKTLVEGINGDVTIPDGVTSIGNWAFFGCTNLTSVTIPDSVTSIGQAAFCGCSGLTSVTIPDSVTSIGREAFADYVGAPLPFINNQPDGLVVLGRVVYRMNMKGTCPASVTIPDGVTSIGVGAFSGCSGLTSVTIPDSVTSIGDYAFDGCSGLTSVTIPDSVTSIGPGTFDGCSGLTSVTIPNSVTSIGEYAFSGCRGLTSVTLPSRWVLSSIFPSAYSSITNVAILAGSSNITNAAFKGCTALTSVSIPDTVTSFGDEAFYNCMSLAHLAIPEGVTSYGGNCFEGCRAYTHSLYRVVFGGGAGGGSVSVVTTIVQNVEAPYALTNAVADRAIASVTVDGDCAIDSFVLKDGKVYDLVLYISNTADHAVTLTLPSGYVYKAIKGARPLEIPANSQSILSITRVANNVFLVSREDLETIQ